MSFKPTDEQKRIFHFIKNRSENLVIDAKAGVGKTTTIVEAIKLIPKDKKIIFLAFNKHIQEELKSRLPENVHCYTFHGLGVGAIKRKYGESIKFDEFKVDQLIKKKAKNWSLDKQFANPYDKDNYLNNIKKLVNLCRLTLTLDKKYVPYLAEKFDIDFDENFDTKRVWSVMEELMTDRKSFDFTDMVFLPAIDKSIWMYQYDYVFTDECQDMNRAQQKIIEKIVKRDKITKKITGRIVATGDNFQAIYGFTGVSDKSYEWFLKLPNVEVLPLTYTFRCGQKIVEHAQKIVPEIKYFENAPEGMVRNGSVLDEPEDGDFVLCRITAPLVRLFFHYLLQGKKATIMGSDIGLSLLEMIDGHKTMAQMMAHWANELKRYETSLRKRGILRFEEDSGYNALSDKVGVINFLGKLSKDLDDMKNKIKIIFSDNASGIILSTIHKAKGLEANRVFIARPDKMPLKVAKAWQYKQEKNLEYVAITRAKRELIYDVEWNDDEEA